MRLVSGTTGTQIGATLAGDVNDDNLGRDGVVALSNGNFVVLSPFDDEGGIVDGGSVRLVSGTTGAQIGSAIAGATSGDVEDAQVVESPTEAFFVVALELWDGGATDTGRVLLVAE